jgi:hypothetical protein
MPILHRILINLAWIYALSVLSGLFAIRRMLRGEEHGRVSWFFNIDYSSNVLAFVPLLNTYLVVMFSADKAREYVVVMYVKARVDRIARKYGYRNLFAAMRSCG